MQSVHTSELQALSLIITLQQEVVTSTLPLLELMNLICQRTQDLTQATGAVVEMAEGEEMVYHAVTGTLVNNLGLRLSIHTSLSGQSVLSGEVLYCEDSETDQRVNRDACRKVGARSMICVPLNYKSKLVGVLKVVSPEAKKFSDRSVNVLRLIAGLLSASIAQIKEAEEKDQALKSLKVSESLLRESEKASKAATKAKSDFLANMSHEIRTPLNGVMGMASVLADTELGEKQREYVEVIKSSAEVLLVLVNDILDFSKIEAKKMSLEKISFDLKNSVEDIHLILSPLAARKNILLSYVIDPTLPKLVSGDPTRIRQVILNLVGNAIKFTSSGSVTIKLSPGDFPQNIRFEVVDTGIGIPESSLSSMFQPFSQVDASTTRKFGGTGLGLSICKQLVELMDGELGVHSQVGAGSTFWFVVQLPGTVEASKSQNPALVQLHEKLRILVAEDNSVNQMIVRIMLEKLGHSVSVAANGLEALEALRLTHFDLVLMDCQMPEMDGFAATSAIRATKEDWSSVHVIAMTAHAMAGDREKCLKAGMNDYVSKPMKREELIQVLNNFPRKTS